MSENVLVKDFFAHSPLRKRVLDRCIEKNATNVQLCTSLVQQIGLLDICAVQAISRELRICNRSGICA